MNSKPVKPRRKRGGQHGGARANSGPPKGTKYAPTLAREAAEAHYRQRYEAKYDKLIDAQFVTAVGVSQFVWRDKAGRFKVIDDPDELRTRIADGSAIEIFTRLPNAQAQTDALSRIMGKPAETHKVTGADDGPIEHVFRWEK